MDLRRITGANCGYSCTWQFYISNWLERWIFHGNFSPRFAFLEILNFRDFSQVIACMLFVFLLLALLFFWYKKFYSWIVGSCSVERAKISQYVAKFRKYMKQSTDYNILILKNISEYPQFLEFLFWVSRINLPTFRVKFLPSFSRYILSVLPWNTACLQICWILLGMLGFS